MGNFEDIVSSGVG